MKDGKTGGEAPFDLELFIAANGASMQHFYTMPPKRRQELLDSISETNRIIKEKDAD